MRVSNKQSPIAIRHKQRRIPTFAASRRTGITSIDQPLEHQCSLLTTKHKSEWRKNQLGTKGKIAIGGIPAITEKELDKKYLENTTPKNAMRSPLSKTKHPDAIFSVMAISDENESYPLSFGVDSESPIAGVNTDADKFAGVESENEEDESETIENLISNLEYELHKLQEEFNLNLKINSKELSKEDGQDAAGEFADLFSRSPPDERILKQYFPSVYKTTKEIFTKSSRVISNPAIPNNKVLDDVKMRMNILADNLNWAKSNRRTDELNNILDSFKVDPAIGTLKLEIKKLVDDCILSLEPEIKDAVEKQLENENKKSLSECTLIKNKQVSRLYGKNLFKKERTTIDRTKESKSCLPKSHLKLTNTKRFSQKSNLKKEMNEENDKSFEKVPTLWDELTDSSIYGNLLKLGKRFSDLNPYPHLQNPLPPKPTPWPPKLKTKANPVKKIPVVTPKRNLIRLSQPKQTIQNKKPKKEETILRAKLVNVQFKKTEFDKHQAKDQKKLNKTNNKMMTDIPADSIRNLKEGHGQQVENKVESLTVNTHINKSPSRNELRTPIKKQVRFKTTPRPIPIPNWSDGSPLKEIEDDLADLKIMDKAFQGIKPHSDDQENLIENKAANKTVITSTENALLIKPVLNHRLEFANEVNKKPNDYEEDLGAAGDHLRNENDEPKNERKQMTFTGGGDAEFAFNKVNDLPKNTELDNEVGHSNSDDTNSFKNEELFGKGENEPNDNKMEINQIKWKEENIASQMSSSSSIADEDESKKSIEEVIEEELSTNTNTSSVVNSEAEEVLPAETQVDESLESEKAEIAEMVILPGYSPPLIATQPTDKKPHKRHKKAKHKIPSFLSSGALNSVNHWQNSNEILMKTAQDWVEKELVARTLSLRLSQNDKLSERKRITNLNLPERPVAPSELEKETLQTLVEEILKEKILELIENTRRSKENFKNADINLQKAASSEESTLDENIIATPLPTPPASPTYSDVFEKSEDLNDLVSTPSPTMAEESNKERLAGGGKTYKNVESTQPPFAAYANQITTPHPSPPPSSDSDQASELLQSNQTPSVTNEILEPFALHRVPEEPQIFVDEATQTDSMELEPLNAPEIPSLPVPSSVYPPDTLAEKATSTPPSPSDATTSTTSPMASSLSEGEWINLKPWQTITPFLRYSSQPQTRNMNTNLGLDNSLQDVEDLEQEPISEGEIRLNNLSAWRSSILTAAIATGIQVDEAFQFSVSNVNITEPGPSTQPSTFFGRPESPGEVSVQVSEVFATLTRSTETESENKHELERRFSACSVQTASDAHNRESPPNLIPIQHIIVEDTPSFMNEEELLLNALQNVFLPAEPGLVLPVTRSLDPILRRQFLERLVSEGEIRASFPLSPNRASNPDHLRSWGRSLVNAMIKKTISAPGLNAHRKADDNRASPIQRLSTIIASRNTSRSSQTQTDFPLDDELKPPVADDKTEPAAQIASTSNAAVSFKEFTFEPQLETNVGTIPKVKTRKSSLKMSHSKVQQDIHRVLSSNSQLAATSSTSIPTLVPSPNCDFLIKRNHNISVRPSPGMLPEDFQGHLQGLHPVISKSSVIDIGQDMFKDSSGTIMMGSLGTIDEESNEALTGVHKRMIKGAHSSDSEGECAEVELLGGITVDKPKKVIDRSLSHSNDLSEGEVPPRETRSHQ